MASERTMATLPSYLRSLIDGVQDGFVLRSVDGTIIEVNQAFLDLVGFDRDEVIGTRPPHPWWLLDENDVGLSDRYFRGAASEERVVYRHKDGRTFPALLASGPLRNDSGEIVGLVGTVKNVTDWATVEEQLAFQAQVIDQAQGAVIATDIAGRVILWSSGAEGLFGYPRAEMVGRNLAHLLVEMVDRLHADAIFHHLSTHATWEGELVVRLRDGGQLPVLTTISSLYSSANEPIGHVVVSVDLRERKRAESRISAQYEVARALATAESLTEGIRSVLKAVGVASAWDVGTFWAPDAVTETLQCVDVWSASAIDITAFELDSRRGAMPNSLPDRVWRARQVIWVADIARDLAFQRTDSALATGLRSGAAFPIETEGRILGVMEFYGVEVDRPDDALDAVLITIGHQVGQFIERRKALASLRESEDRFRAMAESVPIMIWLTSVTGQLEYVNRSWREFTGRSIERDLGVGWLENLHPDDRDRTMTRFQSAFDERTAYEIEYRLRHHDGEFRWVLATGIPRYDTDGTFRGYTGSCVDIDARRRNEQHQIFLSEATRILASSLDYHTALTRVARLAAPSEADVCVIHVVDDADQLQREAVESADQDHEHDPVRSFESELEDIVADVTRSGQSRLYSVSAIGCDGDFDDDQRVRRLRQSGFSSAIVVPIVARDRTLGAISLIRARPGRNYDADDLSMAQHLARRAAVAIDNSRLYREAQESARARDQFLAVAAHELRSPLTSMKGFAQLLLRRARKNASGQEWLSPLETIDMQVNRMADLVNRLLDVSRIEEKRLRLILAPADLSQIAVDAVAEAQITTETHTVEYVGPVEPVRVEIDSTRVTQVLSNLLNNAIRYSPPGTTVTVDLRPNDDSVVVSVRDEGPGVSSQLRERVFERYFSGITGLRGSTEGLGLGLYVAAGIVEAHGGRIWVDSDATHGSTFSFTLPRQTPRFGVGDGE